MAISNQGLGASYLEATGIARQSGPWSMACWAYGPAFIGPPGVDRWVALHNAANYSMGLSWDWGSNAILRAAFHRENSGTLRVASAASYPVATWVHLMAVYDGTNLRLYVNGVLAATVAAVPAIGSGTPVLYLLGSAGGTGNPLNGHVAEYAYWSTALTSEQQAGLALARLAPSHYLAGQECYYPCVGGSLRDASGRDRHLTAVGSIATVAHPTGIIYPRLESDAMHVTHPVIRAGSTTPVVSFSPRYASSGQRYTGITSATPGAVAEYRRAGQATWTSVGTLQPMALGGYAVAGIVSDATTGRVQLGLPTAAVAVGVHEVEVRFRGPTDMETITVTIPLEAIDRQATIGSQVRTELATELARIDVAISTRAPVLPPGLIRLGTGNILGTVQATPTAPTTTAFTTSISAGVGLTTYRYQSIYFATGPNAGVTRFLAATGIDDDGALRLAVTSPLPFPPTAGDEIQIGPGTSR